MTGTTLTAVFDADSAIAALGRVAFLTRDYQPLLKRIGVGMVDATQQHFRDEKDPFGNAWAPLNAAYAATKRGPGILREKAMRGGLMGSMTFKAGPGPQVAWGSGKIYAAVHQFGAVIVPVRAQSLVFRLGGRVVHAHRSVIPARPYLGFGPLEQRVALEMVDFTIGELLAGRR